MDHALSIDLKQGRKPKSSGKTALNNFPNPNKKVGFWERFTVRLRARKHAKKIMQTLHDIEEIHAGREKAKSFDDFLNEF